VGAVGLSLFWCFVLFCFGSLAFPWCVSGLLALPLCGAALTFFAAAKKVSKESGFTPQAHKRVPRAATVVVHLESVFPHIRR
jgi:hypothetical protein